MIREPFFQGPRELRGEAPRPDWLLARLTDVVLQPARGLAAAGTLHLLAPVPENSSYWRFASLSSVLLDIINPTFL